MGLFPNVRNRQGCQEFVISWKLARGGRGNQAPNKLTTQSQTLTHVVHSKIVCVSQSRVRGPIMVLVTNRSLWLLRTNECGLPSLVKVISLLSGCDCSTLASSVLQLLRKHPIMKVRKTNHSCDNTSITSLSFIPLSFSPACQIEWLKDWVSYS